MGIQCYLQVLPRTGTDSLCTQVLNSATSFEGENLQHSFPWTPFHLIGGLNNMILKIVYLILILKTTQTLNMHIYTKHVCMRVLHTHRNHEVV